VIGLVCVFLVSLLYSTLFQSDLRPPPSELVLNSCKCLMFLSAPGRGLGNIGHLCEWGTSSEGGAKICHVECITMSFLIFFPVWGGHSVNHGWLWTGKDVCQVCGHRPLLHQSTVGLAQEWTPPKLQNESQVQLLLLTRSSNTQCILQLMFMYY
jgi:hypothetical protein